MEKKKERKHMDFLEKRQKAIYLTNLLISNGVFSRCFDDSVYAAIRDAFQMKEPYSIEKKVIQLIQNGKLKQARQPRLYLISVLKRLPNIGETEENPFADPQNIKEETIPAEFTEPVSPETPSFDIDEETEIQPSVEFLEQEEPPSEPVDLIEDDDAIPTYGREITLEALKNEAAQTQG